MITSRYAKLYIEQDMLSHKGMISIGPGLHTYSISSSGFGFLGRFSDQLRKAFDAKIPHANLKKVGLWERVFFFSINAIQFQATLSMGCGRKSGSVFFASKCARRSNKSFKHDASCGDFSAQRPL